MTTQIIRTGAGLKAAPAHGGGNLGQLAPGDTVDAGDPAGWTYVRVLSGAAKGLIGWTALPPPAASPAALGIYAINSAAGNWREDWASGQQKITGIVPAIIHRFQPWIGAAWSPWDTAWAEDAAGLGSTPMISWEGRDYTVASPLQPTYSNARVLAGGWDATLIPWLAAAGAWGKPFLLRCFWEANGQWYPWAAGANGNSAGSLIDAWRHVARLVRVHAPNARLVWCPGTSGAGWLPLEDCWPGRAYVDALGLDFYNTGSQAGGWSGGWTPFSAIAPWVARAAALAPDLPLIVCETGCVPEAGQDKAAWYSAIPAALAALPAVRAVVAFDNRDASGFDFRVSADPQVALAWRALAGLPALRGRVVFAP